MASSFLYLLAVILRLANRFRRPLPGRVLVLEPVGLGDMVSFEPLVRELLRREYEVVLCSKPEWRPLFPDRTGLQWLDMRVPWASHNEAVKYRLGMYLQEPTRGDLRAMRSVAPGAIGIDTRGDIRSVILLYWAGCRTVISLSNYLGSDLPMWRAAARTVPFDNKLRRWELNLRFLDALEKSKAPAPVFGPRLDHLIDKTPNERIALIPTAPWAGKLWPPERWAAVAGALRNEGWEVVGLCGPKQADRTRQQLGSELPVIECGSIPHWARELNRCSLAITVDSGPMHLADALDLPVIALYGQGKLPLWAPSGSRSVVIAHQDHPDFYICHPVEENVPLGQKFMNLITVEEVLAAVKKVTAGRAARQVEA